MLNKDTIGSVELKDQASMMKFNDDVKELMANDKNFMAYAKASAKKIAKDNVGVLDIYQMLELAKDYLLENENYKKFIEKSAKPKKNAGKKTKTDDKLQKTTKKEKKVQPKEIKDIFSL